MDWQTDGHLQIQPDHDVLMLPAKDLLALWRLYCPPVGCKQGNEVSDIIIIIIKKNKTKMFAYVVKLMLHSYTFMPRTLFPVVLSCWETNNLPGCVYCLPRRVFGVHWINLCDYLLQSELCVFLFWPLLWDKNHPRAIPRACDASLQVSPLGGGRPLSRCLHSTCIKGRVTFSFSKTGCRK